MTDAGRLGPPKAYLSPIFRSRGGLGRPVGFREKWRRKRDGHAIKTSLDKTRDASHGKGFNLTVVVIGRRIQAKPTRVKLVATHVTAAPIHEFASRAAGTFFAVEGEVEFNPAADSTYVIRGDLKKEGSSVWIEDSQTKERVAEVVAERQVR